MSHVLEHIDDPAVELSAMKQVLSPSGAIFLEVPNGAGHRHLPIDDNRAHLHFFSPSSLSLLLAGQGLETIAVATDVRLDARCADSLQVIARPFQMPTWSKTFLSDHSALIGENEIVVWGAGSLAYEILANFFDATRIAFFIDRNVAKQARSVWGDLSVARGSRPRAAHRADQQYRFRGFHCRGHRPGVPGVAHNLIRVGDLFG